MLRSGERVITPGQQHPANRGSGENVIVLRLEGDMATFLTKASAWTAENGPIPLRTTGGFS